MSKEKQIEAMAKDLQETHDYEGCDAWHCDGCKYEKYNGNYLCESIMQAERLIAKGYRKQSEGEWKLHKDGSGTCSECHFIQKDIWDYDHYQHFCGHCGAKMKGCE